jgi:hypothetical protein
VETPPSFQSERQPDRHRFKTQAEARIAAFAFIEGFYNRRRRHSSIGCLSPIDYERLHAANPDAHQPAAVLATVKDKPSGRPPSGAVLPAAARDGRTIVRAGMKESTPRQARSAMAEGACE